MKYHIVNAQLEEKDFIENQLEEYDRTSKPILQEKKYVVFSKIIKNELNQVIAGGIAYSSMYFIGYIDTLWVHQKYRKEGLGSLILAALEKELKDYGCENCHLDTFDFQAPLFYKKNGYQEFGKLRHEKVDITEYFFSKKLSEYID